MAEMYVESERLDKFATQLAAFASDSEVALINVRSGLGRLGEYWRDDQFHQFVNQFVATETLLREFFQEAKRTVPILRQDAERTREVDATRPPSL
jgi:uncharacterized protein YukE